MAKKRAAFTDNPYIFARSLLDKERSGVLETSIEENLFLCGLFSYL